MWFDQGLEEEKSSFIISSEGQHRSYDVITSISREPVLIMGKRNGVKLTKVEY